SGIHGSQWSMHAWSGRAAIRGSPIVCEPAFCFDLVSGARLGPPGISGRPVTALIARARVLYFTLGVIMTALPKPELSALLKQDRFGNVIDPMVSYARGSILRDNADEILRQRKTYRIARARRAELGAESIYNLTGLIRGFRYAESDHDKLQSYIHFGALDEGLILEKAFARMGGNPEEHDGFLCNRVSAAALATMM